LPPPPISYEKEDFLIRVYGRPMPPAPTLRVGYQYKGTVPHRFNLSISIENLDEYWDLVGFDMKMSFPADLAKVFNVTLGDFSKYYNLTRELWREINSTTGTVWISFLWDPLSGNRTSPSGNGTLIFIELEVNCSIYVTIDEIKLASFPHPERPEPPWNSSPVSVPIPYTLVNEGIEIVGIRQHIISEFPNMPITTESNSIVRLVEFDPAHRLIIFEIEGATGIMGFCNISIPLSLMWPLDSFRVFIDGEPADFQIVANETHAFIYVEYTHSVHYLVIISEDALPEFSNVIAFATLMLLATVVILKKRKQ